MNLKACPDCGSDLGRNAIKCRCGWKSSVEMPKLKVACAHDGCNTPAILREKTETGWANLCEYHWVKAATDRSEKKCRDLGLVTKQDKVDYCRKVLGGMVRWEREPGCDDEPERRYMPGVKAKEVAGHDV